MKNDEQQEKFIKEYKSILSKYYDNINVEKRKKAKLKGALVANLIKKYIADIILYYELPYKVSENNVYIQGYPVECDLLIVKRDCNPIWLAPPIYRPEDVKVIIESKSTGIFVSKKDPKNPFLNELEMVQKLISNGLPVKFGYISLAEQITSNSNRFLIEANKYINDYTSDNNKDCGIYCFSKTYPTDEYPLYEGNPYYFRDYIKHLCL